MDDLIGTQNPRHRIDSPEEALTRLEHALPGLLPHRRAQRATVDWGVVEAELGIPLPGDYRLLAESYPSFAFSCGFITVGLPQPGSERRLDGITAGLDIVRDWWEADMSLGLPPHPAPGGLLPWADSSQGDLFLWVTSGASPHDWPVAVATRDGEWWYYAGGAVQFLAELADGTVEPWGLTDIHSDVTVLTD